MPASVWSLMGYIFMSAQQLQHLKKEHEATERRKFIHLFKTHFDYHHMQTMVLKDLTFMKKAK